MLRNLAENPAVAAIVGQDVALFLPEGQLFIGARRLQRLLYEDCADDLQHRKAHDTPHRGLGLDMGL